MDPALLALDAGTTGVTSLLFDRDLRVVRRAYREFPQHFPHPGWVEHRADELLAALDATLAEVLEGFSGPLAGVGITNQRETVFACDRATGRALAPGIVWQDRRTAARCAELREAGEEDALRARTGLRLDPYFSGTKIEWLLREVPEVAEAAAEGRVVFATVDALIVRHLTGRVWATDPTNASRTLLCGLEERDWGDDLCARFGVRREALPEVRPSAGPFGEARLPGDRRVPILGVAGDQQAALFGQGCWEEGDFKNTYGTGCFLLLNTGERRVDSAGGLLTTLACDRRGAPVFALEGSVFVGGSVVQWLRDQLGLFEHAGDSEPLARSVPDTGGVTLVPAFAGLGAPYWDPDARGALLGLTRGTTRAHLARAALESIAFQCTELVELLRAETGLQVDALRVDGGATANDLLMQLQADLAAVQVRLSAHADATARGAAALAGLAAGLWSDPAEAGAFRDAPDVFEPALGAAERARRLRDWRAAVARVLTRRD